MQIIIIQQDKNLINKSIMSQFVHGNYFEAIMVVDCICLQQTLKADTMVVYFYMRASEKLL